VHATIKGHPDAGKDIKGFKYNNSATASDYHGCAFKPVAEHLHLHHDPALALFEESLRSSIKDADTLSTKLVLVNEAVGQQTPGVKTIKEHIDPAATSIPSLLVFCMKSWILLEMLRERRHDN
ncbi:hypothetical protein LTS18_013058, partial [Coniosporium uncinatum]